MFSWIDDDLDERRRLGLYRVRRHVEVIRGPRLRLGGREYVHFASNDYLNLAGDPRLAGAAARAARRYGCGAGASPLVTGYLPPHRSLERALARWEGTEAALVLSSGFAANLAVLGALAGPEDAIFSDELNHASLIDGCRLARARVHVYPHADANRLHELLGREGQKARRRLIVTDSVFSMDGDLAPLADLVDLARRHEGMLVVDEAHATGVLGANGRGATELLLPAGGAADAELVKVGTLSKALGAQGGFVCGPRRLMARLVNHARQYIFSTALAPPTAAAARCAVELVRVEPERRRQLVALAELLREELRARGLSPGGSRTQIVPLILGPTGAALELGKRLRHEGLFVPVIRPPSVPPNTSRLRISLSAGHAEEDVRRLAETLGKLVKNLSPCKTV
jgi:8-amino-7-oxononanoate synthase